MPAVAVAATPPAKRAVSTPATAVAKTAALTLTVAETTVLPQVEAVIRGDAVVM
jgi:hypothetical protein